MNGDQRKERGGLTRDRILGAGCRLFRTGSLDAVTSRAVAEEANESRGTIDYHFRSHHALLSEVIRFWASQVRGELEESASGAAGLARVWRLSEFWLRSSASLLIPAVLSRPEAQGHDPIRASMLDALKSWTDGTVQALRQAQYKHELKEGTDIGDLAIELHHLLWGGWWTRRLFGLESSERDARRRLHDRLFRVAVDPGKTLPALNLAAPSAPEKPAWIIEYDYFKWMCDPTEPKFHALLRLEVMGTPTRSVDEWEILPEDHAAATAYAAAGGTTFFKELEEEEALKAANSGR